MADFRGLKTHDHLKESFIDECVTAFRYLYFAKIAEIEGHFEVAQLFRDLAEGGICNAHGSLDYLSQVGDPITKLPIGETDKNLIAAISAELTQYQQTYPKMASEANNLGLPDIASWFETLLKLKRSHVSKLEEAIKRINQSGEQL